MRERVKKAIEILANTIETHKTPTYGNMDGLHEDVKHALTELRVVYASLLVQEKARKGDDAISQ